LRVSSATNFCASNLSERVYASAGRSSLTQATCLSTRPGIEEPRKHPLEVIDVALFNILPNLEVITEHRCTGAAHDAELLGAIRQGLHLRGAPLRTLRHLAGPAHGSAKDIAQDLTKNIAARHLRCVGIGRRRTLLPGHGDLNRPTPDDDGLDPALLDAL